MIPESFIPGGSGGVPPGSGAAPPTGDADVDVIKILLSLNARDWMGTRPTVVASITAKGSSSMSARSLKLPGSDSSALQTT